MIEKITNKNQLKDKILQLYKENSNRQYSYTEMNTTIMAIRLYADDIGIKGNLIKELLEGIKKDGYIKGEFPDYTLTDIGSDFITEGGYTTIHAVAQDKIRHDNEVKELQIQVLKSQVKDYSSKIKYLIIGAALTGCFTLTNTYLSNKWKEDKSEKKQLQEQLPAHPTNCNTNYLKNDTISKQ